MFIYWRLLLAHFIGDYPFQAGRVYSLKSKGLLGNLWHATVITLCLVIFLWPFLHEPGTGAFIALVGSLHLIQDWIKANALKRLDNLWIYLSDQCLHVLTSALVFLTPLKTLQPLKGPTSGFLAYYNNNHFVIYLIALIVATYACFYILYYVNRDYFKQADYKTFERYYGMIERGLLVSLFFLPPLWWGLPPLLILLRYPLLRKAEAVGWVSPSYIKLRQTTLSWSLAFLTGLLFTSLR